MSTHAIELQQRERFEFGRNWSRPYEFARAEEIFDFYRARGFHLTRIQCGGVGLGCNEFVFQK